MFLSNCSIFLSFISDHFSSIKMHGKLDNMKNKLRCASYINKMRSLFEVCPSYKDVKVESVPISFDETYRLDYDIKRGVTSEFARTR